MKLLKNQKGFSHHLFVPVIVIVLIVGVGMYLLLRGQAEPLPTTVGSITSTGTGTITADDCANPVKPNETCSITVRLTSDGTTIQPITKKIVTKGNALSGIWGGYDVPNPVADYTGHRLNFSAAIKDSNTLTLQGSRSFYITIDGSPLPIVPSKAVSGTGTITGDECTDFAELYNPCFINVKYRPTPDSNFVTKQLTVLKCISCYDVWGKFAVPDGKPTETNYTGHQVTFYAGIVGSSLTLEGSSNYYATVK